MRCLSIKALLATTALYLVGVEGQLSRSGDSQTAPYRLPTNFTMPHECFTEGTTIGTKKADNAKAEDFTHFEEVLDIDEWDPTMRLKSVFVCYDKANRLVGVISDIVDGSGTKLHRLDPLGITTKVDCDRIDMEPGTTITKMTIGLKAYIREIVFELSDGSEIATGKNYRSDTHDYFNFDADNQLVGFGIEIYDDKVTELKTVTYTPECGKTAIKEYEEWLRQQEEVEVEVMQEMEVKMERDEEEREAEIQALREIELEQDEEY